MTMMTTQCCLLVTEKIDLKGQFKLTKDAMIGSTTHARKIHTHTLKQRQSIVFYVPVCK